MSNGIPRGLIIPLSTGTKVKTTHHHPLLLPPISFSLSLSQPSVKICGIMGALLSKERRKRRTEREKVAYQGTDLVDSKVNHVRSTCRAEGNREIGEGNRRIQRIQREEGEEGVADEEEKKKEKKERKQKRADAFVFMPKAFAGQTESLTA